MAEIDWCNSWCGAPHTPSEDQSIKRRNGQLICGLRQFNTPSGVSCARGEHGGSEGYEMTGTELKLWAAKFSTGAYAEHVPDWLEPDHELRPDERAIASMRNQPITVTSKNQDEARKRVLAAMNRPDPPKPPNLDGSDIHTGMVVQLNSGGPAMTVETKSRPTSWAQSNVSGWTCVARFAVQFSWSQPSKPQRRSKMATEAPPNSIRLDPSVDAAKRLVNHLNSGRRDIDKETNNDIVLVISTILQIAGHKITDKREPEPVIHDATNYKLRLVSGRIVEPGPGGFYWISAAGRELGSYIEMENVARELAVEALGAVGVADKHGVRDSVTEFILLKQIESLIRREVKPAAKQPWDAKKCPKGFNCVHEVLCDGAVR